MSNELVPLSYARDAYNALHNTELKTHTDALTAEQAAQINNNYDIKIYVGTHGHTPGTLPDSRYDLIALPTQQEYEEAAAVVAGMQAGDTLFVEHAGFNRHPTEPRVVLDHLPSALEKDPATFAQRMFGQLMLSMAHEMNADARRDLEQARSNYQITAFVYAQQLAALKGIRTVYADQDAFDMESLHALTKGKRPLELIGSPDAEDQALAERIQTRRERSARNLIKDWALDHLPQKSTPRLNDRKPKLVLLFGGAHKAGLEQTFSDLGLDADVTVMKSTNLQERAIGHIGRVVSNSAALIPSLLGAVRGTMTPLETPHDTDNKNKAKD